MSSKKSYSVLLVDDSEDDSLLIKRVIQGFPRLKIILELRDGVEAVDYLSGRGQFTSRRSHPIPDLMLLDLKMPRKSGYDVLKWLKLQSFPAMTVIVLSGSVLQEDLQTSLALGAHGYWSKTADAEKQRAIVVEILELLDGRKPAK